MSGSGSPTCSVLLGFAKEQLARGRRQLEASAGAQEGQLPRELPEAWAEPGELVELLPSACSEMWELHRLQHLDLAHMGGH